MAKNYPMFDKFAQYAAQQLGIKKMPAIRYVGHEQDSRNSFGGFQTHADKIEVRTIDRHPVDVMRTIAHELCHYKWKLDSKTSTNKAGDSAENYANAKAGEIMRKYDDTHGFLFKAKPIKEDGIAAAPANVMGGSSSTAGTGGIDTIDPLLKKKKLRTILSRRMPPA